MNRYATIVKDNAKTLHWKRMVYTL